MLNGSLGLQLRDGKFFIRHGVNRLRSCLVEGEKWDGKNGLMIPGDPKRITAVKLLRCSDDASINGMAYNNINWNSNSITFRNWCWFKIQIFFDTSHQGRNN